MIISRVKVGIIVGWLTVASMPIQAETPSIEIPSIPAPATSSDGRDASFLPPASMPNATDNAAGSSTPAEMPTSNSVETLPQTTSTPAASPAAATTSATPTSLTPPVTMPSAASETTTGKPVELSQPVESGILPGIDPDTVGTLATENGGLGTSLWKGTPREIIDRLLPSITLPTSSATLNGLAQRFFLTTANVPEGKSDTSKSLTTMRVEKLIALGATIEAWNLASMAKNGQVDETTVRLATEAALLSKDGPAICSKATDLIRSHGSTDWQKILIVCQLRNGDKDAAQLGLDVLHTQNLQDDVFFELTERNVIAGVKSLPRQLKPLKPLSVALLRLTDTHLTPELYAKAEAAIIPELLLAKTRDDIARLNLAERSAARGLISSVQLAEVYRTAAYMAEQLNNPINSMETGARLRALLYQTAQAEKKPQQRLDKVAKFVQSLAEIPLNSAMAQLLADLLNIPPTTENASAAPLMVRVLIMAGKPKEALGWLKIARDASDKAIAAQLQSFWPLLPLGGLETDSDYAKALSVWLDTQLKDADRPRREQIGNILLVFEAAGFAVPESGWARVIDVAAAGKRVSAPPTVLLERLRTAGTANRRGEALLLALAANDGNSNDTPFMSSVETIRALRLVALPADALSMARETVSLLLAPPAAKP